MSLLNLCLSFFKIGLFTVGGGMAMLPLLIAESEKNGWLTPQEILDMIAISESTPGPIAVNMATYVGYLRGGLAGSLAATFSVILPGFVITSLIAYSYFKLKNLPGFTSVFSVLRPAGTGLMVSAFITIAGAALFFKDSLPALGAALFSGTLSAGAVVQAVRVKPLLLFVILVPVIKKTGLHPVICILGAAAAGIIFKF
ncbi:MAG: chromate transporter [Spirochaetales bacterium]|jgi:chromate transporter|nr:chromate transporter [Spirochaetales bacterium]